MQTLHPASLDTLKRLRDAQVGLVILDECHHLMGHWGRVLADGGDAPGYIIAEIDPAKAAKIRRSLPSLTHDRPYQGPG